MSIPAGTVVDRKYEILSPLARGGMGSVFRARHVLTEQIVALKVIEDGPRDEGHARRFKLEVSVASKVQHASIVKVQDAGIELDTGRFYIAMELLEGRSLRDVMSDGDGAARDLRALADRRARRHRGGHTRRGVVHRDLKPDNLFVERVEGEDRLRILDFGIARDTTQASLTTTGVAVGTAHYMSPEQATADKSLGPATDVWAIGAMLYEVLSGRRPFDGASAHAVVVDAVTKPHASLSALRPDLEEGWSDLVDACLAKRGHDRPTCPEVHAALSTLLEDRLERGAPIPSCAPRSRRRSRRRRCRGRPRFAGASRPSSRRAWRRRRRARAPPTRRSRRSPCGPTRRSSA